MLLKIISSTFCNINVVIILFTKYVKTLIIDNKLANNHKKFFLVSPMCLKSNPLEKF